MGKFSRWSANEKKRIQIKQPKLVREYNTHMGGVDLLDRFMGQYRPTMRSKKWWWPFFSNALNMAVVAAWRLHRFLGGKLPHLDFRRHITRSLLKASPRIPRSLSQMSEKMGRATILCRQKSKIAAFTASRTPP
jgi:hypothetical protein